MLSEMYLKAIEEKNYLDAYLIIKNLFSKNPKDVDVFKALLKDGLYLTTWDIDFAERKNYLNEVSNALAIFTDAVELDTDSLALIHEANEKVASAYNQIISDEEEYLRAIKEAKAKDNTSILTELASLHETIKSTKEQEEFDSLLEKVSALEQKLDKRSFSEHQIATYDTLTKNFSSTISIKMEELNKKKMYVLNQQAIKNYKHVFDMFSKNKNKYLDSESNLKALLTEFFFKYDTRQLFNETLIYYNHVYSLIFNEVSEDLKYKVTVWSIEASKAL